MSTVTQARNGENGSAALPAVREKENKLVRIVEDEGPLSYLMDTARFEHMQRLAQLMASGTLTPKHLQGKSAVETMSNCFRVANQAIRWGMDPFALMDETYVVGGKLAYQGKLVIAVVNSRANMDGRLQYLFEGQGMKRQVTIIGKFKDEAEPRTVTLTVEQGITGNDMWKKDPDQKLIYSAAVKWARRHCPDIVLGVLTEDDMEHITEQARPIQVSAVSYESNSARLAAALAADAKVKEPAKPTEQPTSETVDDSPAEDKQPDQPTAQAQAQAEDIELSVAGLPLHDGIGKLKTVPEVESRLQELVAVKSKLNVGEFEFIKAKLLSRRNELASQK